MRAVRFHPGELPEAEKAWWSGWQAQAGAATLDAIQSFETWLCGPREKPFKCTFRTEVWSELKRWMLERLFFGKCAYCETRFVRSSGHAEHFRPKGSVLIERKPRRRAVCELPLPPESPCGSIAHPGYFWLAYHWQNLVPACEYCNSNEGKVDLYPVAGKHSLLVQLTEEQRGQLQGICWESRRWPGWFYRSSEDLDAVEQPLIINPLNPRPGYEPGRHLRFGAVGMIAAVDESRIGGHTIATCNLDAPKLREERQRAQELIRNRYFHPIEHVEDEAEALRQAEESIRSFREHREPYSTAALDHLESRRKRLAGT